MLYNIKKIPRYVGDFYVWLIIVLKAVMTNFQNPVSSNFLQADFYSITDNLINKNLAGTMRI